MFKYTSNTLKKIEDIYRVSGYIIRYEKGNFKAGYCILENRKVVVVNKYYDKEARINCLIEILPEIEIAEDMLSNDQRKFLEKELLTT